MPTGFLWLATRITHEVVGVAQHPYLQAVNLVQATKQDPHVWTHDGDMSETFGLEPNFGCCTAK